MAWGNPDLDMTALMNPQWAKWFDTVKAAGGGRAMKFAGGKSAPGSNQMRGVSQQPGSVHDPRANPLGPTAIMGMHGGDDGDLYAALGDDYATTNPSLHGLQSLIGRR